RLITFGSDLLAQHHTGAFVTLVLLSGNDVSDHPRQNHARRPCVTCESESTIPMIVQSVGVSSRLKGKLASFPRHQNTSSPTPAPTESTATIGFPAGSRSRLRVCTTRSLRPSSESFLTVATTVPITRASCIVPYAEFSKPPLPLIYRSTTLINAFRRSSVRAWASTS